MPAASVADIPVTKPADKVSLPAIDQAPLPVQAAPQSEKVVVQNTIQNLIEAPRVSKVSFALNKCLFAAE